MSDKLDLDFSWKSIKARFDAENPVSEKQHKERVEKFKVLMEKADSIGDEEYYQQIEEHQKLLKEKKAMISKDSICISNDKYVVDDSQEDLE